MGVVLRGGDYTMSMTSVQAEQILCTIRLARKNIIFGLAPSLRISFNWLFEALISRFIFQ